MSNAISNYEKPVNESDNNKKSIEPQNVHSSHFIGRTSKDVELNNKCDYIKENKIQNFKKGNNICNCRYCSNDDYYYNYKYKYGIYDEYDSYSYRFEC